MSKLFETQLLTPDGPLFEGKTLSVKAPGMEGNFQILYNHAPLVSALGVGEVSIKPEEADELHYAVSGGFVEINDNKCTILAEKAELSESISIDEAKKEVDQLKSKLKGVTQNREGVELELEIAENRLKIAEL